jgi:hypothetical protein
MLDVCRRFLCNIGVTAPDDGDTDKREHDPDLPVGEFHCALPIPF